MEWIRWVCKFKYFHESSCHDYFFNFLYWFWFNENILIKKVPSTEGFSKKEEVELSLQKLEKDLNETRGQRDKALQELNRLKQHLLEKVNVVVFLFLFVLVLHFLVWHGNAGDSIFPRIGFLQSSINYLTPYILQWKSQFPNYLLTMLHYFWFPYQMIFFGVAVAWGLFIVGDTLCIRSFAFHF